MSNQQKIGKQQAPLDVHLQFGDDSSGSVVISWAGEPVDEPAAVRLADLGYHDRRRFTSEIVGYRDGVSSECVAIHHCQVDGLEADRQYCYAIEREGRRPQLGSFRTAPRGRSPFRFTVCGDMGTPLGSEASDGGADLHSGRYQRLLIEQLECIQPLFHLSTGDLSYANESADPPATWRRFFSNISRSASLRPWMPCAGNHENEAGLGFAPFQHQFQLPGNGFAEWRGLWYSFSVGSVLVVALNNDDVCYQDGGRAYRRGYSGGLQLDWLRSRLGEARRNPAIDWIVVSMHQPAVSTADHNGADLGIREQFLPLFDEFEVDLVLCGHEHNYERSHPVRGVHRGSSTLVPALAPGGYRPDGTVESSQGTVHVVVGGGGAGPSRGWAVDEEGRPRGLVIVGTERPGRGGDAVKAREPAAWSAVRGDIRARPFGFAVVEVDPGSPGGTTSLTLRALGHSGEPGAALEPFDELTLVRRRRTR